MTDGQFTRAFAGMIGGLVVMTIGIAVLANFNASEVQGKLDAERIAEREKMLAAEVEHGGRIRVGEVANVVATAVSSSASAADEDGASLYQSGFCSACHASGAAGAPILGDAAQWADRIAKGEETLIDHAINGFNGMPPRGGSPLTDDQIKLVVEYMIAESQ